MNTDFISGRLSYYKIYRYLMNLMLLGRNGVYRVDKNTLNRHEYRSTNDANVC